MKNENVKKFFGELLDQYLEDQKKLQSKGQFVFTVHCKNGGISNFEVSRNEKFNTNLQNKNE